MPPQTQTPPVAAQPKPHEHDSVAVTNVDVNCHESTLFTVERSIPVAPTPGENNPMNIPRHQSQQQESSFEHSEYFEVRYNSQPFRILPGETKIFPRYIAEHFAKHLADHMLQKMEDEEERNAKKLGRSPRKGLVQSNVERPKMLDSILEVKVWFLDGVQQDMGVPQADNGAPALDIGNVPNYAMGNLKPEPKSAEQILAEAGEYTPPPPPAPAPPADVVAQPPGPVGVDTAPPEPSTTVAATTPLAANGLPLGPDSLDMANTPPAEAGNAPDGAVTPNTGEGEPAVPGERTKSDLIKEAVLLDIPVTGRETVDELKQKIASF